MSDGGKPRVELAQEAGMEPLAVFLGSRAPDCQAFIPGSLSSLWVSNRNDPCLSVTVGLLAM